MKIRVVDTAKPPASAVAVEFVTIGNLPALPRGVTLAEFSGNRFQTLRLHAEGRLLVGIGRAKDVTHSTWRDAAAVAISTLRNAAIDEAFFDDVTDAVGAVVEGALLGNYLLRDSRTNRPHGVKTLMVRVSKSPLPAARKAAGAAQLLANAVNLARQINNQPGNVIYPETLAAEVQRVAENRNLKVTVLDEQTLKRRGFGGILAVGSGSARPPRFIVVDYPGTGKKARRPIALIGKAITFDTGGISIKPHQGMEEMIFDKSGGTTVLGTMAALADLRFPHPVVGLIASAENMPGSSAYRPGDIVKMYDGTTVEIVNTDAEGRMVLADAIAFARQDRNAAAIIDFATLTGACGVALGPFIAGLWSNDDAARKAVLEGGAEAGEPLWPMPLGEEFTEDLKSHRADIKNCGGRLGGACTAAAFLAKFAGGTPWVHLDIAYPSVLSKPRNGLSRGATGFGLRTAIAALKRLTAWQERQ